MNYKLFTIENLSDIESVLQQAKECAEKRHAESGYNAQSLERIVILGEEAIDAFCKKYNVKKDKYANPLKTDGKTSAEIIPYIDGECGYTVSHGGEVNRYFSNFGCWRGITSMVKFDETLMVWFDAKEQGKPARWCIFNDNTDYYNYLPYGWREENPEPNKMGTITDKKAREWKNWLTAKRQAALNERDRREGAVVTFMKRIGKIDKNNCQRYNVGETSGEIIRNGLCFSWTISNGVVSQKLDVHYTTAWRDGKDKLDAFNEMCAGKYVGKL